MTLSLTYSQNTPVTLSKKILITHIWYVNHFRRIFENQLKLAIFWSFSPADIIRKYLWQQKWKLVELRIPTSYLNVPSVMFHWRAPSEVQRKEAARAPHCARKGESLQGHRSQGARGQFFKWIFNSGLFWAVGAAERKKIQTAISMLLLRPVF